MGIYLNPGNEGFKKILKNNMYVDKTGLIAFINQTLDTEDMLTCISRPRRFGKTLAAKMLCAYYDKSCASRKLFEGLEIANNPSFEDHLNQYNIIYIDMIWFISHSEKIDRIVSNIQEWVIQELRTAYPGCISDKTKFLAMALTEIYQKTHEKFFFIIDEWDALFREAKDHITLQKEFIQFLRGLFKSGPVTDKTIIGAYMTGILPIKKYGTESALTDFREFTMAEPDILTPYVGFTEEEILQLCTLYHMDFEKMKMWYDGYSFMDYPSIYNPNSVMQAIKRKRYRCYWTNSESYESLKLYITSDVNGLKDSIIQMLGGQRMKTDTHKFQNDLIHLKGKDQILTLLIHLGYLAYDEKEREVYIPNLEVAEVFKSTVEETGWEEVTAALSQSDTLLQKTLEQDTEYVAASMEEYHQKATSILQYNNENSLACALKIAYYTAIRDYEIIRELPTGKGFADLVFVPRKHSDKPAMIVELKYHKSAESALQQIKDKKYFGVLEDYTENLLLVGINYDKTKGHTCAIEKYRNC